VARERNGVMTVRRTEAKRAAAKLLLMLLLILLEKALRLQMLLGMREAINLNGNREK
jgi:hypothetical protein